MSRIVVLASGGVDSSVALLRLAEEGRHSLEACYLKIWLDDELAFLGRCPWEEDLSFVRAVCELTGVPLRVLPLQREYFATVVEYALDELRAGRTPSPDVVCNRAIKFGAVVDRLGGEFELVASGHHARVSRRDGLARLLRGADPVKDQSYFLCQVSQEQLAFSLFPLGDLIKPRVREIAGKLGLATAQRKDSQGICFVGKVHLPTFLQQKLKAKQGDIIEIPDHILYERQNDGYPDDNIPDDELTLITDKNFFSAESGKKVGSHNGAHFFTIGQRKGINVGGYKEPLFVLDTDIGKNLLFVGEGQQHPGLYRKGLFMRGDEVHWIRRDLEMKEDEVREYDVRIRYRQPLQKAKLYKRQHGLYIVFNKLQRGVAPGQFAAWYNGEELMGSGVICS